MEKTDPEVGTGYPWVLVAVCALTYMMFAGSAKTFGVLYTELLQYFGAGAGNTAWVGSVAFFLIMGLGPVANHLCVVFTFRKVMITGGILLSSGYLLSSFVPRMEWMYLTFGLITGTGYGLLFSPSVTVVNYYIHKRRALANGMIVSGSGIGIFIFPYLYRALINEYGLRGALMMLSGIFLHTCIAGAIVRQPKQLLKPKAFSGQKSVSKEVEVNCTSKEEHKLLDNHQSLDNEHGSEMTNKKSKKKICENSIFDMSVFRMPSFTVITLAFTIHGLGYLCTLVMLPAHVVSLGYSKTQSDLVISLAGAGEIVSRIFFGWIADKSCVKRTLLFTVCALISGVAAILITFFDNYSALIVYGVVIGVFPGAFLSLASVVVIDIVGMDKFPAALGKMYFFMAFTNIIGPPISGWFEDETGSWLFSFRVSGSLSLLAAVLVIVEPFISKCWCCHLQAKKGLEEEIVEEDTMISNKV